MYAASLIEGPGNHTAQHTHLIEVRSRLQEVCPDREALYADFEDGHRRVQSLEVLHDWMSSSYDNNAAIAQGALITRQAQRAALFLSALSRFEVVWDHTVKAEA